MLGLFLIHTPCIAQASEKPNLILIQTDEHNFRSTKMAEDLKILYSGKF